LKLKLGGNNKTKKQINEMNSAADGGRTAGRNDGVDSFAGIQIGR